MNVEIAKQESVFEGGDAVGVDELKVRIVQLEAELERMQLDSREAQASDQAKGLFLASMSHEIRTPMNAVIGFCDLLSSMRLDEEQRECVDAISSSGQLLIQLINQVLDYSKIEEGHLELRSEPFDIGTLLRECGTIMAGRARMKGLDFKIDCEALQDRRVMGDPIRLRQIFINLLSNATKFTHEGRVVARATSVSNANPDWASFRFEFEDDGIGINEDRLGLLFEPFRQVHESREYGGTGLGMAISKRLCEAMNGSIDVTSELGEGTIFTIELDLLLAAPEFDFETSEPPALAKLLEPVSERLKVLIVDDDPNNLLITTKLVEHLGYEARTVNNGIHAIEELRKDAYAIALMDVQMAPIDGIETARRIRAGDSGEDNRGIYIIALTARALEGDRQRSLAAGMDDYLAKPLSMEQLAERLDRAKRKLAV